MTNASTPLARPDDDLTAQSAAQISTSSNEQDISGTLDTPEYYDPAEYRWVPVRRRPRYDGWTEEKQRRFIEALSVTPPRLLA